MLHKATISEGRFDQRPIHVACSCGTQGDFRTEQEAKDWIQLVHFRRLTGICTSELSSAPTTESAPEPSETSGADTVKETVGDA